MLRPFCVSYTLCLRALLEVKGPGFQVGLRFGFFKFRLFCFRFFLCAFDFAKEGFPERSHVFVVAKKSCSRDVLSREMFESANSASLIHWQEVPVLRHFSVFAVCAPVHSHLHSNVKSSGPSRAQGRAVRGMAASRRVASCRVLVGPAAHPCARPT